MTRHVLNQSRAVFSLARSSGLVALLLATLSTGCQRNVDKSTKATGSAAVVDQEKPPAADNARDIDSHAILDRTTVARKVEVKHVLISWKELAPAFGGRQDPRGAGRDNAAAATLALEMEAKIKANPENIDAIAKEFSEDPGSQAGQPYTVTADSALVPEFKQLGLRLTPGEVGIVKTQFGYHVMIALPPPPPDPVESNDILARPAVPEQAYVQHILIAWKDVPAASRGPLDPRAAERTKVQADELAIKILAEAKGGADFKSLMKKYSEDTNSKDSGKEYPVPGNTSADEGFPALALRLNLDEIGVVKSPFGFHIMKRVGAPPPDALNSADILAREPQPATTVKHILLAWKDIQARDPRAQKRTRAELEALVKKTVAALKKGAKIEPLMKELSEDPGSAATGMAYPVTATAGLVPPFKDLSLRLNMGEVGVVATDFGIHIIQRVADDEAKPKDPIPGTTPPDSKPDSKPAPKADPKPDSKPVPTPEPKTEPKPNPAAIPAG